jgi:hypothetical protein
MSEKADLIYRSILILLFIAFLVIFYQYSQNGRYTYHRAKDDAYEYQYIVDSRTGIAYGYAEPIDILHSNITHLFYTRDILKREYIPDIPPNARIPKPTKKPESPLSK